MVLRAARIPLREVLSHVSVTSLPFPPHIAQRLGNLLRRRQYRRLLGRCRLRRVGQLQVLEYNVPFAL